MADDTRNFALREQDGEESSVFSGRNPRQAALKAARREAETFDDEDRARANAVEVRLRERGTDRVHVYEAWAWEEEAGEDAPDWLGDTVREANVSKQGVEHTDEF